MSASNPAAANDAAAITSDAVARNQARLAALRAARPTPPQLPIPTGPNHRHVPVSTAEQFAAAIENAQPGDVILLADGLYNLPDHLTLLTDHVQIRGASQNPAKVLLDGTVNHMQVDTALLRIKRARHVTIADVTFQNSRKYGVMFYGDAAVRHLTLHHCRFHNIWARGLKGTHPARPEDNPGYGTNAPDVIEVIRPRHGRVEYCEFTADHRKVDRTDGFDGDYISGFDLMSVADWRIADNLFFNIQGANGGGRGAIFIWVDSRDVLIENNWFVDCDRAIALGNPSQIQFFNMDRAELRHNTILGGPGHAIECHSTRDVYLHHNRIVATQTDRATIEWKYGSHPGRLEYNEITGKLDVEPSVHQAGNRHTEALPPTLNDAALVAWLTAR